MFVNVNHVPGRCLFLILFLNTKRNFIIFCFFYILWNFHSCIWTDYSWNLATFKDFNQWTTLSWILVWKRKNRNRNNTQHEQALLAWSSSCCCLGNLTSTNSSVDLGWLSIPGSAAATRLNNCFTLWPAFADVSINMTFNSFAFCSPSSVVTCLQLINKYFLKRKLQVVIK